MAESLPKSVTLRFIESGPHQRDDRPKTGLVHFHAIEEALYHDDGVVASGASAVHIEKDLRFGKSRRDAVARLRLIHGPSAIGHQFSVTVVDRNDQSPMHQSWPRVEADSKLDRCLFGNSASGQIGMSVVDASKLELQG